MKSEKMKNEEFLFDFASLVDINGAFNVIKVRKLE